MVLRSTSECLLQCNSFVSVAIFIVHSICYIFGRFLPSNSTYCNISFAVYHVASRMQYESLCEFKHALYALLTATMVTLAGVALEMSKQTDFGGKLIYLNTLADGSNVGHILYINKQLLSLQHLAELSSRSSM